MGDRFGEIWGISELYFLLYCRINSAKFWHFLLIFLLFFLLRWLNSVKVPVHCYTNTTEYCRKSMLYCRNFELRFLSEVLDKSIPFYHKNQILEGGGGYCSFSKHSSFNEQNRYYESSSNLPCTLNTYIEQNFW